MSAHKLKRELANKRAHRFPGTVTVTGIATPGLCRYSRLAGKLPPESKAELAGDLAKAGHCAEHGKLDDPAIMIIGEGEAARVAFICPWCSGPEIQEAWEREGAS